MPRKVRLTKRQAATLATLADGQPHEITRDTHRDVAALRRLRLVTVPAPPRVVPSHLPARRAQGDGPQARAAVQAKTATITRAGAEYVQAHPVALPDPPQPPDPASPAPVVPAAPAQPDPPQPPG